MIPETFEWCTCGHRPRVVLDAATSLFNPEFYVECDACKKRTSNHMKREDAVQEWNVKRRMERIG